MKTKSSDNPTPRNLESGFSDDGAGTTRCLCSTCRSSVRFCSVRMSGHEKSNYAGLYARQAYQTKKDSLSQPATAARNLRYETDATIAQRFANFAAKASPAFGKFYRFSESTPIDVSSSNVINGSTPPMPFDKFVDMKISRGCRNYYLPFWWLSRRTRSCRVVIPLRRILCANIQGEYRKEQPNHSCPRLSRRCKKRRVFRKRRAALLLHLVVCIWHEQHKFGLVFAALVPVSPSSGSSP
jgi:hypothetical protein